MRVYVEYDDHHNPPIMLVFGSEEEALHRVAQAEGVVDEKEVWERMFNEENDDCFGEYTGNSRWTLINEDEARYRSDYWERVAEAIRFDRDPPTH
jgi:hypothetical protein